MRAGSLNRTITIERGTDMVSPAGSVSTAWAVIATLKAELLTHIEADITAGFGEVENASLVFRTRYKSGLTTTDRLIYRGEAYAITTIAELGNRRDGVEIRCERAAP